MHRQRTGYTNKTKYRFMLGEGMIFKNLDPTSETSMSAVITAAIAAGKLLGATQGGSTYNAKANTRNIEVDGIAGKVTDLDEIDSWDASLQTTFIETTVNTIRAALGATSVNTSAVSGYTKITPDNDFESSDYFTNIAFVGSMSGSEDPIILIVKNAIGNGELSINVKNNDESKVPCTFEGRYSIASISDPPFEIWVPDEPSSSNG
ncbi:MAG: hypothetical protein J5811_02530 [Lachnospiraceae bacterium]|nr:hypothetical protein [Lachnospiraceae bacterium]